MTFSKALAALALALSFAPLAYTQTPDTSSKPDTSAKSFDCRTLPIRSAVNDCAQSHLQIKTFYLSNALIQNDANEILVAARNMMDPSTKIYLVASQNAITVNTYPAEIARIEALIHDLDRPHKTYRLTYTFTDVDSGKRGAAQHYSMVVIPGQTATLKEGSKIPIITGTYSPDSAKTSAGSGEQTQFTYLDIGINLQASLMEVEHGASLSYKVEQSSIGETPSGVGPQDPIVRQTVLTGSSVLTLDKPTDLGSVDIPGSTRHVDISATLETVK